jgi:hypothetical protein
MELTLPTLDPGTMMRTYRDTYVNLRHLLLQSTGVPARTKLATPAEQPIEALELPAALQEAITAYQAAHPEAALLTPIKYMKVVQGSPELVIEDDTPLPAETALVTFSHTVTTLSATVADIVTHQLVATLTPDGRA